MKQQKSQYCPFTVIAVTKPG